MSATFSSKAVPSKVPVFVDEELTCLICDSYSVEENKVSYECHNCGTTWKVNNLDR